MHKDIVAAAADGRNLLRALRLAVCRLESPDQEAGILARGRKVLDRAGVAYDHCRLYRVKEGKGGEETERPQLDAGWIMAPTPGRGGMGVGHLAGGQHLLPDAGASGGKGWAGPAIAG